MRNKELTLRRIQSIQSKIKELNFVINRGTSEDRVHTIKQIEELLEDLRTIIEREN